MRKQNEYGKVYRDEGSSLIVEMQNVLTIIRNEII